MSSIQFPSTTEISCGTVRLYPEQIPNELKQLNRWVTHRNKRPFMAEAVSSPASVTDPDTWSSFETALTAYQEGGYDGVGIVFDGDGLVGIDLDGCVFNGKPNDAALEILDELGPTYTEFSQSGTGLHAYGRYAGRPLRGLNRQYKGIGVELYCTGRFFAVTGAIYQDQPVSPLTGFRSMYEALNSSRTEETEEQKNRSNGLSSSVSSVRIPPNCIPSHFGQRNASLFKLARFLKGVIPGASKDQREELVSRWWLMAEENVRTKDVFESILEFDLAWERIKFVPGESWSQIIAVLPEDPESNPGDEWGITGRRLFALCLLLDQHQRLHHSSDPFLLPCRKAGEALEIDHRLAANLLNAFVRSGLLEIAVASTTRSAARYRLKLRE